MVTAILKPLHETSFSQSSLIIDHLGYLVLDGPAACSEIHHCVYSKATLPTGSSRTTVHSKDAKADLFLADTRVLQQPSLAQGLPDGFAELPLDVGQSRRLSLYPPSLPYWIRVRLASCSEGSPSLFQLLPHFLSQTFLFITTLHLQLSFWHPLLGGPRLTQKLSTNGLIL